MTITALSAESGAMQKTIVMKPNKPKRTSTPSSRARL
jgi:hypothetical protein